MAVGCGAKCAKFLLFAFNIVFWLSGLALIIIGAIYASKKDIGMFEKNFPSIGSTLTTSAYGCIVLGCIIFVVGFCGCCGAIRESKCLLGFYIFFLVVVMAAELAVGIFVAIKRKQVESEFKKIMTEELNKKYGQKDEEGVTQKFDDMFQEMQCCGLNSSADFKDTKWKRDNTNMQAPDSCCKDPKTCGATKLYFKDGCYLKFEQLVLNNFPILIGIGCGIAFLELFGVICAVLLCCNTGDEVE